GNESVKQSKGKAVDCAHMKKSVYSHDGKLKRDNLDILNCNDIITADAKPMLIKNESKESQLSSQHSKSSSSSDSIPATLPRRKPNVTFSNQNNINSSL